MYVDIRIQVYKVIVNSPRRKAGAMIPKIIHRHRLFLRPLLTSPIVHSIKYDLQIYNLTQSHLSQPNFSLPWMASNKYNTHSSSPSSILPFKEKTLIVGRHFSFYNSRSLISSTPALNLYLIAFLWLVVLCGASWHLALAKAAFQLGRKNFTHALCSLKR